MMKKLPKKYIPFIVLIFLLVFVWVEEVIIGEGYFTTYLHLPEHKILRFSIRAIYALVIFGLGYIGLVNLKVKLLKVLWVYWYILSAIAALIRIILDIFINDHFGYNIWNFLVTIYVTSLTPFPYLFLYILYFLFPKKQKA